MKKEFLDFINIIYILSVMIKNSFYFNILYDKAMDSNFVEDEY